VCSGQCATPILICFKEAGQAYRPHPPPIAALPRHTTAPYDMQTNGQKTISPLRNHRINIPRASLPVRSLSLSLLSLSTARVVWAEQRVTCYRAAVSSPSSILSHLPGRLLHSSPPKKSSRLAKRQLLSPPLTGKNSPRKNHKLPSPSNPSRSDRASAAGRHGHLLAQLSMAQLLPRASLLVPLCCSPINPSQSLRRFCSCSVCVCRRFPCS
jgi:hypothetical protein